MMRQNSRQPASDDDDVRWYALDVARQKEYLAGYFLNRMGYPTFIPTETRWRKKNRYTKAKVEIACAAVPGVIFVALPIIPPWGRILGLSLVSAVLSIADTPVAIDTAELWRYRSQQLDGRLVIERVKLRSRGAEVDRSQRSIFVQGRGILRAPKEQRHMRSKREVHVGGNAVFAEGPFRFVTVKVEKIVGARAQVLLPLFGSSEGAAGGVRMTVPLEDVEAVA